MDASKRISDLIVISRHLADLLTRENKALREHTPEEVRNLLAQKEDLSRAYGSRISGLAEHANAEEIAKVDPALKDQLRSLGADIQTLSAENTDLLKVAMEVNRRVLHEVGEAVKSGDGSQIGYTKKGTIGYQPNRGATKNVAISLDKSL